MEVKAATMRDRVNDADNQGKWFRYEEAIDDYVKRLFMNKTLWSPSVLWIRNDLFRIRIQLWIFLVLDPDPSHINKYKKHLKFKQKEESINYLPFSILYYSPTVNKVSNSQRNNSFIYLLYFIFCWIRIWNNNFGPGSRQKIRIQADPDPQHWSPLSIDTCNL